MTTIGLAEPAHPVMTALARRVPLTLLMDLADPAGPDSRDIGATEVADLTWLRDLAFPTPQTTTPPPAVIMQHWGS